MFSGARGCAPAPRIVARDGRGHEPRWPSKVHAVTATSVRARRKTTELSTLAEPCQIRRSVTKPTGKSNWLRRVLAKCFGGRTLRGPDRVCLSVQRRWGSGAGLESGEKPLEPAPGAVGIPAQVVAPRFRQRGVQRLGLLGRASAQGGHGPPGLQDAGRERECLGGEGDVRPEHADRKSVV